MLPATRALGATAVRWATSSQLRASTREDHLASESALDLGSLDTLDAFAALLRGWATVWQSVWQASHASSACSTARVELSGPAEQALDQLATDLTEVTVLSHSGGRPSPDGSRPAGRLDPGVSGRELGGRFSALLEEPSTSWGVAYVLLGSRLGGAVLAPVLSGAVGLPAGVGTSLFRSDGIDPGREWVGFRRRLDSFPLSADQLAVVVDAARWTFVRVGTELSAANQCDREPIHLSGAVQSHGCLLAVDAESLVVVAASNPHDSLPERVELASGRTLDMMFHLQDPVLVVELEEGVNVGPKELAQYFHSHRDAGKVLSGLDSVEEICRLTAHEVRKLTGYDRVMVYRFEPDAHGHVLAEECRSDLQPLLGLHCPPGDIPRQARALYLRNWIRVIEDVDYAPVPIEALPGALPGDQLDLSLAVLRGEASRTLRWAGRPTEGTDGDPKASGGAASPLRPRASFAEWREQVRGRSLPRDAADVAAAVELAQAMPEVVEHRAQNRLSGWRCTTRSPACPTVPCCRIGDEMLVVAAQRIAGSVRSHDVVARIGGDEFVVLLPETEAVEASRVGDRVVEALREPFLLGGRLRTAVSASIGVAVVPVGTSPGEALRQADVAMYYAKRSGRDQAAFYDFALGAVTSRREIVRDELSGP